MKIQKQSHKLRFASVTSLVILAVLTIIYVIYTQGLVPFSASNDSNPVVNYDAPTDDQSKAGSETKGETINNNPGSFSEQDNPKQPEGSISPDKNKVVTSITASEVNNSTLYVRNEIKGLHSSGTCTLTLKRGGEVVTKESGIQPLAKISTCKGFDIPTSELSAGTWYITLVVTINGQKGTAQASVNV